jgi:hypothetical protein
MTHHKLTVVLVALTVGSLCVPSLSATKVQQMNLEDLVNRADRIFRGIVVGIEPGFIEAGGGAIPTTTYRIRVEDAVKGNFGNGVAPIIEIRMVGSIKADPIEGDTRRIALFKDLPRLKIGSDYLLFTTAPSSIGLSTTVGLGQGCFNVIPIAREAHVLNGLDNHGLFLGMDRGQFPESGPISYLQLTSEVRTLMGQ